MTNIGARNPDEDSFKHLWKTIINPEIKNYLLKFPSYAELLPFAQEEIWSKYREYNIYCKKNYMVDSMEKIDRHKTCACYIMAIVTTRPLRVPSPSSNKCSIINETLAITVGLSLLRALILSAIEESKKLTPDEKKQLNTIYDGEIKIPSGVDVNHGDYIFNFANELYFASRSGRLCILSIAHSLYLLELFTKYK